VGPRNHIFDGGPGLPMRTSNFERTRGGPLCKNGQTDRDVIWEVDSGGSREAYVLDKGAIWRPWRIRLSRPCAAAMRTFCQITLTIHLFDFSSICKHQLKTSVQEDFN